MPHFGFASAAGRLQEMAINDLNTGRDSPADPQQGTPHPPTFLTADDIDNYIYQIDVRLAARDRDSSPPTDFLPTLAPIAGTHGQPPDKSISPATLLHNLQTASNTHSLPNPSNPATSSSAARDLAVRNPTSVYNWLRKHAPKTFLQDHEISAADHAVATDETSINAKGGASKTSRGGAAADRRDRPSARSKKPGSSRAAAPKSRDAEAMDLDDEHHPDFLTPSDKKAPKRKRVVDDDPGYRPKGGSSRSRAKKRKSLGGGGGEEASTPSAPPAKKARKSVPAKQERHEEEDEVEEGDAITARGQEED